MDRTQTGNTYGPLTISNNALLLPNGMFLKYPNLRYVNGEFLYFSGRFKGPIRTHGPRLIENIIQALARIVITDQILDIQTTLPDLSIVLTVLDEIVCQGSNKKPDETLTSIISIMKKAPIWCKELPLNAEGNYSKLYTK